MCQARTALSRKLVIVEPRVCKIPETLEDDAIVELLCITDQQIAVGCLAAKIYAQAITHVIDAAAHFRRSDHIDQRTGGVRNRNFDGATPQRFQPEKTFGVHTVQEEHCALRCYALSDHTPRGKDEG